MPGGDAISQVAYKNTMIDRRNARNNPFYSIGVVGKSAAESQAIARGSRIGAKKITAANAGAQAGQKGSRSVLRGPRGGYKGAVKVAGTKAVKGTRMAMSASQRMAMVGKSAARATMTAKQAAGARRSLDALRKRAS